MNQPVDIIKLLSIVSSCPKGYMLFFSSLGRMEFVCVYVQENLSHNVFIHRFSFLSEMKVNCFTEVGSSLRVQRGVFDMSWVFFVLSPPLSGKRKGSYCRYYFSKPLNYISAVQKTVQKMLCAFRAPVCFF